MNTETTIPATPEQKRALQALAPDLFDLVRRFVGVLREINARTRMKEGVGAGDWYTEVHFLREEGETLIDYCERAVVPIRVMHLEANSFTIVGGPLADHVGPSANRIAAHPDGWSLEFGLEGVHVWFSFQRLRQDQVLPKLLQVLENHGHNSVTLNQKEIERYMDIVLTRLCRPPEKVEIG